MTPREKYRLSPVSLRFSDKEVESDYQHGYTLTTSRTIAPLVLMLLPSILLVGLLELTHVFDTPVRWQTAAWISAALTLLWVISAYFHRQVEMGVVIVFFVFNIVLLGELANETDLLRFLPALFMVIILSHCVGFSFRTSSVTSLSLLLSQVGYLYWRQFDLSVYLEGMTFLVPGFTVAAAAGYTMERQRRLLFSQIRLTRAERDRHETASMHDPLTGLPNRTLLAERFTQSVARSRRQNHLFAIMFIDLDDFKTINDTYDHATGDAVLKGIADGLNSCVREEDTVARLGGDEFVVLSEEVTDEPGAVSAAERILDAVAAPVKVDGQAISVRCSIGVAICPRDGEDLAKLISKADEAMYLAKQEGKGRICVVTSSA